MARPKTLDSRLSVRLRPELSALMDRVRLEDETNAEMVRRAVGALAELRLARGRPPMRSSETDADFQRSALTLLLEQRERSGRRDAATVARLKREKAK